jgi:hypothetical protein
MTLHLTKNQFPHICRLSIGGTYWMRACALFQKEEERKLLHDASRVLETMIIDIFAIYGWRFNNKLNLR